MAEFGEALSPRETDVLHEMVNGGSNKEIATALSISPNTVKVHVRNIFTKMGATSRTEAVTIGLQQGLIDGVELIEEEIRSPLSAPIQDEPDLETPALIDADNAGFDLVQPSEADVQSAPKIRPIVFLLPLFLILIIGSIVTYRQLEQAQPEPFVETQLAERGWWLARPLDKPRAGMATVGDGLNIYRIGGESADGIDGSTATFNSRDKMWSPLANKPTPVTDAAAAVVAGQIYVVGGRTAEGATDVVEVYSPAGDVWRGAASLPIPLAGAVVVSDGELLYAAGGENGQGVSDHVYIYHPIDDSWRPLPPLPTPRSFATGGLLIGSLYIVGGRSQLGELDTCERFNTVTEQWASCPRLLQPRAGAQALAIFDKLYVLGGGFESTITSGELFDAANENWSVVNIPIDVSWTRLGVANIETRIYLLGGERNGQLQAEMYAFEPRPFQIFLPSTRNEP